MTVSNIIPGRYKLVKSDNFDEFLSAIGVGYIKRKLAQSTTPEMEIVSEGNEWRVITRSALSTSEVKFKLGEEFEETRQDGVTVTSLVVAEGDDKWVYTQKPGDGKDVTSTREYSESQMIITNSIGEVTSTRTYDRL